MRSETEVIRQLLAFAQKDERVRAVIMNGSRVNPNAPKDIFCDFDVVFAVTDPECFLKDQSWIGYFGEHIIIQQNDCEKNAVQFYIFLVIFKDGIRIDLSFFPMEHIKLQYEDSLKVLLLDKDNVIDEFEPPSDSFYYTRKPSKARFEKTINNFWWCSTNVARGIWRDELCYAKTMYEVEVKDCVQRLLAWYIGINHDWQINTGKWGKWFKKYLPEEIWTSFVKTFPGAEYDELWEAMLEAGRLVRRIGTELADRLGYEYPLDDDKGVCVLLERIRILPTDANEIF